MPHFEPCAQCGKIECTCIVGGSSPSLMQPSPPMKPLSKEAITIGREKIQRLVQSFKKKQIGGDHYLILPIQPWTIIDANKLNFYEGCALKYLLRKKGNRVEELQKAIHYLEHEIECLSSKNPRQCLQCGGPSSESEIGYYGCCIKCAHKPLPTIISNLENYEEEPGWDQGFWLCGSCGVKNKNCWRVCHNCQKEK